MNPFAKLPGIFDRQVSKKVDGRVHPTAFENLSTLRQMQAHGPGNRVQPRPFAIRAGFAVSFLPAEPRFLDGIGTRSTLDIRQVKELPETAAIRTPTLRRII